MRFTGNGPADYAIFFSMLKNQNRASSKSKMIDGLIVIFIFGCGAIYGLIQAVKWLFS